LRLFAGTPRDPARSGPSIGLGVRGPRSGDRDHPLKTALGKDASNPLQGRVTGGPVPGMRHRRATAAETRSSVAVKATLT
jgi:hypothetical protein